MQPHVPRYGAVVGKSHDGDIAHPNDKTDGRLLALSLTLFLLLPCRPRHFFASHSQQVHPVPPRGLQATATATLIRRRTLSRHRLQPLQHVPTRLLWCKISKPSWTEWSSKEKTRPCRCCHSAHFPECHPRWMMVLSRKRAFRARNAPRSHQSNLVSFLLPEVRRGNRPSVGEV